MSPPALQVSMTGGMMRWHWTRWSGWCFS
jgi:hypothetical protein